MLSASSSACLCISLQLSTCGGTPSVTQAGGTTPNHARSPWLISSLDRLAASPKKGFQRAARPQAQGCNDNPITTMRPQLWPLTAHAQSCSLEPWRRRVPSLVLGVKAPRPDSHRRRDLSQSSGDRADSSRQWQSLRIGFRVPDWGSTVHMVY